jgi:hypothetical protein
MANKKKKQYNARAALESLIDATEKRIAALRAAVAAEEEFIRELRRHKEKRKDTGG